MSKFERSQPSRVPRRAGPSQVATGLQAELDRREKPDAFTDTSMAELVALQHEYVEELGAEAIRQARRNRADVVSTADVQRADELIRSGSRGSRGLEALGGILAGAGAGQFLQVLGDKNPSNVEVALAVIALLVGAILVTASLVRRR